VLLRRACWTTIVEMKVAASLLLLSLYCFGAGSPVPRKAPSFGVQTGPEKYTWLNEYEGKTVILAFVLTDCDHCQYTTGLLNTIQQDYAARGVQVLESAIDSMSALRLPDFVARTKASFPVGYNDAGYATRFLGYGDADPMYAPQIVFIDRNGMIRAQFGGDDPRLLKDVQDKTLRDTLDGILKTGQDAGVTKKGPPATRPTAPKQ